MFFRELLAQTIRNLLAHKLRSFLTMFGIAWGIVSITLMVAAGEGLRVGQRKARESLGKDILIVFGGQTSLQAGGLRAGRRVRFVDADFPAVRDSTPDCQHVVPELGNPANVRSDFNSGRFTVTGSHPVFQEIRTIKLEQGRFYNEADLAEGRRVAIIGDEVRRQLFGTRPALGASLRMGEFPYEVIGLMEKKDQDSNYDGPDNSKIFIPFSTIRRDFPDPPPGTHYTVDRLIVTPKSYEQHDACEWQLRSALARTHSFDPRDKEAILIWDTVKEAKLFAQMTDGMKYFLGAVGVTTLLLGGIGVMNIMLVAVQERTREIGIRKSLGATRRNIMVQFFSEALLLVGLSGGTGIALALTICFLVNQIPMPQYFAGLLVTPLALFGSALALALVGIGSGLYPAWKASLLTPVEALRYEAA
jgi:putative ABC transport system permease protein